MKNLLFLVALALVAFTAPARAVSIVINQDDAVRQDFTIHWSDPSGSTGSAAGLLEGHWYVVIDNNNEFIDAINVNFGLRADGFGNGGSPNNEFEFLLGPTRTFAVMGPLSGAALPDFIYPVTGDEFAARFVYGEALPGRGTGSVPDDSGSTLLLFAAGLGVLGWGGRRMRSPCA